MSSGMTGQTPCLSSRWDKPAQPKQSIDVRQQGSNENAAHSVSLSGVLSTAGPNNSMSEAPETAGKPQGGVEMAAAMAAKINAMLMAKGKLLTPPPLLAKAPSASVPAIPEEMVITEVDINDVPLNCRDLLTKVKTQEEIRQFSGAVVSTKGLFMSETDRGKAGQRPLHLHVQGKNQEQVNKAVMRIKEIISADLLRASAASGGQQVPMMPPITLYPQPPRPVIPSPAPRMPNSGAMSSQGHRPAAPHTGSFVHTKIFVGLDQTLQSFNVNEKIEGPGGSYLSHIQTETGARVFLRGKNSGYIEQASKRESFEPLYVYISHPNAAGLEAAKKLTESLLETVRAEHARMVSIYTATGSTQSYPAHGYSSNSSYANQGSWYSYPANGYAGGYSAYPGASGYWNNANDGPSSHSNMATNPQPSQTMVQYPVCPRQPHSYLVQNSASSENVEPKGSSSTLDESESPSPQLQQGEKISQPPSSSAEAPSHQESEPPTARIQKDKVERILMPPPPSTFLIPAPVSRKRPRDAAAAEDPVSVPSKTPSMGVQEELRETKPKPKVEEDALGLVPYDGDSSDEEEERTLCSKADSRS